MGRAGCKEGRVRGGQSERRTGCGEGEISEVEMSGQSAHTEHANQQANLTFEPIVDARLVAAEFGHLGEEILVGHNQTRVERVRAWGGF